MDSRSLSVIKSVRRRLQTLGLSSQESKSIANRLKDLVRSNGLSWTIQYLKGAGDCLWCYLYGSPTKGSWKKWISTHSGFPRVFLEARGLPEDILARIAKMARAFTFETIQDEQVRKVRDAVVSPYTGEENALTEVHQLMLEGLAYFGISRSDHLVGSPKPVTKQFRKVMSVSGPTKTISRPPLMDSIQILKSVPLLRMIDRYDLSLVPLDIKSISALIHSEDIPRLPEPYVGEISSAQEGGGKLRMFASPYTVVQCLLSPIHDWIDIYRRQCPSDCTYDQASGALFAQEALVQGKTVYSVDLSTATCRFPLEPQLQLLKSLGLDSANLAALKWACMGKWKVGRKLISSFGVKVLQWEVGQPLGIRPSMSMFSLSHNLLLAGMSSRLGIPLSFRVLGDDVVIIDKDLHEAYTSMIDRLGVPISWNKSHTSARVAEFAGFTISLNGLTRPGQWKQVVQENVLSYAQEFGVMEHELSPSWIKVQQLYLFGQGLYTPTVDQWNWFLRRSSSGLDPMTKFWVHPKPDWYPRICKEWQLQFPNKELSYLPESESDKVGLLFDKLPGFDPDFRTTFIETAKLPWRGSSIVAGANQALLYLFHTCHIGLTSVSEVTDLCQTVIRAAHEHLYSPPPSKALLKTFSNLVALCNS